MNDEATRMKHRRDATVINLTDKLSKLDEYVSGTIQSVTDTVQSARDSVDLKLHVRRRPWTLLAGAVVLGFLGGYRSRSRESRDTMQNGVAGAVPQSLASASVEQRPRPVHDGNDFAAARPPTDNAAIRWAKRAGNSLDPEFAQLKTFAVGLITGLARDALTKHASRPEKSSVSSHSDNGPVTRYQGSTPNR